MPRAAPRGSAGGLEETADILSDPPTPVAVDAGLADIESRDTVALAEARREIKRARR